VAWLTQLLAERALRKEVGRRPGSLLCSRVAHTSSIASESGGCVLAGRAQLKAAWPPPLGWAEKG